MPQNFLRHPLPYRLHKTAQSGDVRRMRELIADGIDVNAPGKSGVTALFYTANTGTVEGAWLLLDNGADADYQTSEGGTPLHGAIFKQHTNLSLFLLENGVGPCHAAAPGVTLLHMASLNGMPVVVQCLLFAFRKGLALTRVSQQDGWLTDAGAFGKENVEDELLSRFRNDVPSRRERKHFVKNHPNVTLPVMGVN
jgi:hypothetical protein